ncbi:MAG: response regulator transcription factor [Acidimicrobiales bacterium]
MRAEGELLAPAAVSSEGDGWWWKVWRAGAVSVLVVSESVAWRDEVAAVLDAEGYAVRLDDRGDAVLEPGCPFDVAVVDLAITGRSAAGVFATLRARSSLPILAVSPSGYRELAVLEAYAAGADQYVTRDVRSRELTARIRALLRRSPPRARSQFEASASADHPISLDLITGRASVAGVDVRLTPQETEVLHALLQRPGRVVSRDQLIGPRGGKQGERALHAVVRNVRAKLEAAEGRRRIVAVRGVGFRLVPDAELRRPAGPAA